MYYSYSRSGSVLVKEKWKEAISEAVGDEPRLVGNSVVFGLLGAFWYFQAVKGLRNEN